MGIALRGYGLFPCPDEAHAGDWCGNTAWLPGYPLLIRALVALGRAPRPAAVLVSAVGTFVALALVWTAVARGRERSWRSASSALALAAFFPGMVYCHAIFPLGPFVAATLGSLLLAARGRSLAAGLAGAAAAFTYPPGTLLAPVLATGFVLAPGERWSARLRRAAVSAAVVVSGLLAAWTVQYADTGNWRGFALVQSGYRYGARNPFAALADRVGPLFRAPFEGAAEAPAAQTLLVLVLVLCATVASARALRGGAFSAQERFVSLYVVAAWLLPLLIGEVEGGLHRREAALLPLVLLTARLPPAWQWTLAALAAVVAYPIALLFLASQLV